MKNSLDTRINASAWEPNVSPPEQPGAKELVRVIVGQASEAWRSHSQSLSFESRKARVRPSRIEPRWNRIDSWDVATLLPGDEKTRGGQVKAALAEVECAVREAAGDSSVDPIVTIAELDRMLNAVVATAVAAEGRMRLLLKQLRRWSWTGQRDLAELPTSIACQFEEIRKFAQMPNSEVTLPSELTIATAERLVASVIDQVPEKWKQDVTVSPRGHGIVAISWGTALRWLVEPARLSWPGVKVTAVSINSALSVETNYYHFARAAIAHAISVLE